MTDGWSLLDLPLELEVYSIEASLLSLSGRAAGSVGKLASFRGGETRRHNIAPARRERDVGRPGSTT
jgi:hypothetical protein